MKEIKIEDHNKIVGLISALMLNTKIYLFGSRARGTNSPVSDIDIAVDSGVPLSRVALDEAHSILQASNIIHHIDVVDFNRIPEKMRTAILHEGKIWKL